MAEGQDNIIRRKDKATWGFTAGPDGQVKVGVPTDPQAPEAQDMLTSPPAGSDSQEKHENGGGTSDFPDEDSVTYEYLDSLTKAKLVDLAAAHEITLDNPKGKKDELVAELAAYYEVEPAE